MSKKRELREITETTNSSFQCSDTPEGQRCEENALELQPNGTQEPLSMVEKCAISSIDSFKASSISLASAASGLSLATSSSVVRTSSMAFQAQNDAPAVIAADSVFSIESQQSMERVNNASAEFGLKGCRISGVMGEGGFVEGGSSKGKAKKRGQRTITVRTALCFTFISMSSILCGLIIFLSWSNALSANEEARDTCDDSTSILITHLHQQIINSTYQLIETFLTPPIVTNNVLELALLRGDMIPANFDINMPVLWDIQRSFLRKDVKNMAIILFHPETQSFRSVDPLLGGGHVFWMKSNHTVCTGCIFNGKPFDSESMFLYLLPEAFVDEPFSFANLVFMNNLPGATVSFDFLASSLSQPQQSSGHGRLEWGAIFSKPSDEEIVRLTIMLGHCVYVTAPCELVVGADLNLDGLGSFISSIHPSPHTRVMILESSGLIVAATNSIVAVYDENGEVVRLQYHQLNDTILIQMGDSILKAFKTFSEVVGQGTLPSADGITTSFARYSDKYGLHWVLAVGVVDDDFLKEIREKSEQLQEKQNKMSVMLLAYGAIILSVGSIIFQLITSQITSPLKWLTKELADVAEFNFEEIDPLAGPTATDKWNTHLAELSAIGHSFDVMSYNMHCFSRYIPPSVVTMIVQGHLSASLGVEPKFITVFFSDLLNFTSIAESLPPRVLIETLGTYLDHMSRIIMANKGTVGEFVGDGILAFWNSPYDVAEHQARACDASLIMQQVLAEARLAQEEAVRRAGGAPRPPELRARMGVTAGHVLHGNIGTPDRMKFGVVGDAVNTASRLESLCGYYGVGILVSQLIEKAISEVYVLRHVDRVVVKGKRRTTELFELICKKSESSSLIEEYVSEYHHIMELYWGQQFSAALTRLEAYCKQFPDDMASALMVRRCEYYCKHPPEQSWNGVYTHYDKEGGGALDSKGSEATALGNNTATVA